VNLNVSSEFLSRQRLSKHEDLQCFGPGLLFFFLSFLFSSSFFFLVQMPSIPRGLAGLSVALKVSVDLTALG
jgi:hypothetical protein